jgi:hypothetical protein
MYTFALQVTVPDVVVPCGFPLISYEMPVPESVVDVNVAVPTISA